MRNESRRFTFAANSMIVPEASPYPPMPNRRTAKMPCTKLRAAETVVELNR